jgi:thiamine biosynthesis protein ThiC
MNAHATFNNFNTPALQRSLVDVVAEYDLKLAGIGDAVRAGPISTPPC